MIRNYIKVALRNLKHNKAYAIINVVGLSLGITCGILIFMLVSYHLSFDSFHRNKQRIYRVVTEFHEESIEYQPGVPQPLGKAVRDNYSFAEHVARIKTNRKVLISLPGAKDVKKFDEEETVAFAEPQFFDIFNFPLLQGDRKTMLAEPNTAIITQKMAAKYFGTEEAIGKIIRYNNKTDFKVTGILKDIPNNTDYKSEIYLSYLNLKDAYPDLARDDSWTQVSSSMQCFLLLKPSVTQQNVDLNFVGFAKKYLAPEDAKTTTYKLQPLNDIHFNTDYSGETDRRMLWAFALVGLFLIVTACVNFINLATAQVLNRAKEVGVRKVMGGVPKQLFWQFISETALITLLSVAGACVLAYLALPYLNDLFGTKIQFNTGTDIELASFLVLLSLVVIFLSGSYPGLVLAKFQPVIALKGEVSQKNVGGFSLRRVLVITQFAISQVLIIGTIVIASQMNFSRTTDLGFNKQGIILLPVPTDDKMKMNTLHNRLASVPGVESVSICHQPPASQSNNLTGIRYGNNVKDELWEINEKDADDQYIKTFGLKLIAGRNLFPSDTSREFVVNEVVVKKLNLRSPQDIIGKMIRAGGNTGPVVGVIKNFHNASFRQGIAPVFLTTNYQSYDNYAIKVNLNNAKPALAAFDKLWTETYPDHIYSYQFLDERLAKFYDQDNTMLKLIEVFACIAILIGCLGLYGLISFMALRKTKEIGVRKVLGASVQNIIWLFGREFGMLVLVAFVIAAPLAWWAMHHYLQDFKYRIALSPWIFLSAVLITIVISSLTVSYRSVKAALANPVKSLRSK
ncbi:ABC transporter permease [Mucilaginibacter jinjuensis]|uniref:ABC transporter permease n=1 Tax=Mucilaginibacter jinjuensis TaxID=1176721 RepID=A0ABY7T4B0_9SPHI|nr:ABC transporter permease [Mucilaginibacter jinjuensis]WCT10542.1 ABC transporter permease [Mucilaginibacter jinjuensis]